MVEESEEKTETVNMADDARAAAKELRDANAEKRELLEREEKLYSQKLLGGKTDGGQPDKTKEPEKSQEEIDADARVKAIGDCTGAGWAKDMGKDK